MQMAATLRTAKTAMGRHGFPVIAGRGVERMRKMLVPDEERVAQQWCAARAISQASWAMQRDPELWAEAQAYATAFEPEGRARLAASPVRFGGGAPSALLYFLVRWRRPEFVVETGVAAGWSSAAILSAMERNGAGHLWSSDFPYFKQPGAAAACGTIVPEELRHRWTLLIDGDGANLAKIVTQAPRIDLFHYDSDKSYAGRVRALAMVEGLLADDAVVAFDDIQDNRHFRDIAGDDATVFSEGGKYVGLLRE